MLPEYKFLFILQKKRKMKNLVQLLIVIIFAAVVHSCSEPAPTFEEQLEESLSSYFKIDSVDSYLLTDTVFVANLDSAQALYEESNKIMELSKAETQIRIDSAELRLAEAKVALEEMTFDMLKPFAQETVDSWESTLLIEQSNMTFADSMLNVANIELDFIAKARKTAIDDKAFYNVLTSVKGEEKMLFVTPNFQVIRED